MSNVLKYKGYTAKIEYSADEEMLIGTILGINDLILFQSESTKQLEEAFHSSVDDYLDFCKEVGKKPNKEYPGTFNIRISPDLHKKATLKAKETGATLNRVVSDALSEYLADKGNTENMTKTIKIVVQEAMNDWDITTKIQGEKEFKLKPKEMQIKNVYIPS